MKRGMRAETVKAKMITRPAGAWLGLLLAVMLVQAEQLPIKTYTTPPTDGLGHNRVTRIIRDSHGFLWFCTAEGLSRFDGSRFVTYGPEQGMPFPSINDLLEARGCYWVATNGGGVIRFNLTTGLQPATETANKARFTTYLISPEPATNRVNKLLQDRAGALWAATDGGLFRAEPRSDQLAFRRVEVGSSAQPELLIRARALSEDSAGNLWIGSNAGLFRRSPAGRMERYALGATPGGENVYTFPR